jgi:hypothetical protein
MRPLSLNWLCTTRPLWETIVVRAFFIFLSIVLAVAVLAPKYGVDSRELTRRGANRQSLLSPDDGHRYA